MNEARNQIEILSAAGTSFRRDREGNVWLRTTDGERIVANVVGAFPLTHPRGMVSLRDVDGREIAIIDDLRQLDPDSRRVVAEEVERSYFMPRITDILDVEENLGVVEWDVQTNKGRRNFQVRHVRQNVRRMGKRRLVIKDVDGNRYDVRDWMNLPADAQKLIEPYM